MNKDSNRFFDTMHLNTDLKKRSIHSGVVTLTSQGLLFLITLGSTMVLARLLTPQDYGMIAMVATFTGFASIFGDLGLSTATIQRPEINQKQVSNLFWINVVLGIAITILITMFSPVAAWFYKTPQLLWVTAALSLNFLVTGLAIQHKALLTRQMKFWPIAKIEIGSTLAGITVAMYMAMQGYQYWALVCNSLVASASRVAGFWIVSDWRPSLPQRKSGVRSLLRFGTDIAGFNIINYFSRNFDNILIGIYWGAVALGLYSKAYQLLMMPISILREPLSRVAMPSLSRLQYQPDQYRSFYIKFISILAFCSMPMVVYMFVCSDNIIRLILGAQWLEASEIFKILSVAGFIQPVATSRGMVLLSIGQSRKCFRWGGINGVATVLSFIIGLPWGGEGVAIAYTISNYLILYPSLLYVFKDTPIRVIDFFLAISKPAVASIIMGVACFIVQESMSGLCDIAVLTISFVSCFVVYCLAVIVISGGTKDIHEFYSYARLAFTKN